MLVQSDNGPQLYSKTVLDRKKGKNITAR